MKKLFVVFIGAVAFTSCTVTTFLQKDFKSNYDLSMSSKKELAMAKSIPVYLSEREVPTEFTVKSINSYSPIVLPIIGNRKKTVTKSLYKKAVKTANSQGGNGVIICDDFHFKVIEMK